MIRGSLGPFSLSLEQLITGALQRFATAEKNLVGWTLCIARTGCHDRDHIVLWVGGHRVRVERSAFTKRNRLVEGVGLRDG